MLACNLYSYSIIWRGCSTAFVLQHLCSFAFPLSASGWDPRSQPSWQKRKRFWPHAWMKRCKRSWTGCSSDRWSQLEYGNGLFLPCLGKWHRAIRLESLRTKTHNVCVVTLDKEHPGRLGVGTSAFCLKLTSSLLKSSQYSWFNWGEWEFVSPQRGQAVI